MRGFWSIFGAVTFAFNSIAQIHGTSTGHAIHLVSRGENSELVLTEEGVRGLQSLTGEHFVVAAVGPFHSGKSFLLNALRNNTQGFETGPTVNPTTEGIWMWSVPVQLQSGDSEKTVILLDTEGLAAPGNTADYDAKIFAVAALLSSHLLYNTVRIIDEANLEYLEVLARRARLFQFTASSVNGPENVLDTSGLTNQTLTFPSLTWIVQDFFQMQVNQETPDDWLDRLLQQQQEGSKSGEFKYAGLKSIFPRHFAHTMFLPASDLDDLQSLSNLQMSQLTPKYQQDLENLTSHLVGELGSGDGDVVSRSKNWKPTSESVSRSDPRRPRCGREIANYLGVLLNAANNNMLAELPSLWELYIKEQISAAREQALKAFRADLHGLIDPNPPSDPVSQARFDHAVNETRIKAFDIFSDILFSLDTPTTSTHQKRLREELGLAEADERRFYAEKVERFLRGVREDISEKMTLFLEGVGVPQPSTTLNETLATQQRELEELLEPIQEMYPSNFAEMAKFVRESLENQVSTKETENRNALQRVFRTSRADVADRFVEEVEKAISKMKAPALSHKELERIQDAAQTHTYRKWETMTSIASLEADYAAHRALVESDVRRKRAFFESRNEEQVQRILQKKRDECLQVHQSYLEKEYPNMPLLDASLEQVIQGAAEQIDFVFEELFARYGDFPTYEEIRKQATDKAKELEADFRQRNIEALSRKVTIPLKRAFRRSKELSKSYWLWFRLKWHAEAIAKEEIGKELSETQRDLVVKKWLESRDDGTGGYLVDQVYHQLRNTVLVVGGAFLLAILFHENRANKFFPLAAAQQLLLRDE